MVKKAAQATPNELLIRARLERGWTQKDVADRVGAPLNLNVNRWERGTARPSAYYVQRLCEVFGKSASELGLLPSLPQFKNQETITGDKAGYERLETHEASGFSSVSEPERSSKDLPTGTITLFFIDMVESTRLLQQLGDGYTRLLGDYRQIIRTAFRQWNGYEVDTQGDAFFAVFARTLDAITAAVTIQRAMIAHSWAEHVTVLARIGLHTGEPQLSSEGYVGLDVHHAARIMSVGHPGQILLSQTTHDLIQYALSEDMFLRDLGEHRLKDIQQPTHLFQLSCPDLPTDFPPPRSLNTPLWNVPFRRNPFFTGRTSLLERLHDQLNRSQSAALTQSHALTGLGGIGKTQSAVEYAYRYRNEYHAIFWVRAASRETLAADYIAIARLLSLPAQDDQDQMQTVFATKRWLEQNRNWLLILDNADTLSLLSDFLPDAGHGHILLTTQAQATGKIAVSLPVDTLNLADSVLLLLRRARLLTIETSLDDIPRPLYEQAQVIVEELDGLPLALDQAGAYIEETECSLADYVHLYRRRRLALLSRQSNLSVDYPRTVANTWSLSFSRVEQASEAAAELLRLCAFLHADAIPEAFITDGAEHLPTLLQETVSDPLLFNEAIQLLRRYSLLKRNPETHALNIHRLVQVVLKESMDKETRRQWSERTLRLVNTAFPDVSFDVWSRCELCMPHVQMCVDVIDEYALHIPEAFRLLHQAGRYLHERGQYSRAETLLQRAISIAEQLSGNAHPDVAHILTDLAESYWSQTKYEQAEILYQRALLIYEQTPDASRIRIATILNDMGMLYEYQEQYEQAEAYLQRSLTIREQELEATHADIGESFNNLAWVSYKERKYEQAEQLYQRGLAIREQTLGSDHPTTAQSLDNLALLYSDQGNYEQAEPLLQRALTIFEQSVGPKHQDTAIALRILADLYAKQEQYERARPLYQQALAIFEQALGSEHPYVALCLQRLARLDVHEGNYEQALRLYRQALAIREQVQGSEHIATIKTRKEYEEVLQRVM